MTKGQKVLEIKCVCKRDGGRACLPCVLETVGEDLGLDTCQLASGTLGVLLMPHPKGEL